MQPAYALFLLGRTELFRGRPAAARPRFLESLAVAGAAGDRGVEALNRLFLGELAFDAGEDDDARAWAEEALAGAGATGSRRNASSRCACWAPSRRAGATPPGPAGSSRRASPAREVGRWMAAEPAVHLANLLTEQHDRAGARALLT